MKKKMKITLSVAGGVFVSTFLFIIGSISVFILTLLLLIFLPRTIQYNTVQNINKHSNFEYELLDKINSPSEFEDASIHMGFGIYSVVNNKYFVDGELSDEYFSCDVSSWPYFFSLHSRITSIECSVEGIKFFNIGVGDSLEKWERALKKEGFKKYEEYTSFHRYEKNNIRIQFSVNYDNTISNYRIYIDPPAFILEKVYEILQNLKIY